MRYGILGTGVVGKTIAGRLDGIGHEVMVGTRDPEETMSRTEPDQYGNPPFNAWQQEHPDVRLGAFGEAGVERVLTILQAELKMTMGNCGTQKVADITRAYVNSSPWPVR